MGECQYKKVLEEISPHECQGRYCFYKIFFGLVKFDQRALAQIKCMEMYKWEINRQYPEDIGWDRVVETWIKEGWAQKYADIYSDELTVHEIYCKMFPDKCKL